MLGNFKVLGDGSRNFHVFLTCPLALCFFIHVSEKCFVTKLFSSETLNLTSFKKGQLGSNRCGCILKSQCDMELSHLTGTPVHFTLIAQCQVFSDKKVGAEQFLLCVFVAISFKIGIVMYQTVCSPFTKI